MRNKFLLAVVALELIAGSIIAVSYAGLLVSYLANEVFSCSSLIFIPPTSAYHARIFGPLALPLILASLVLFLSKSWHSQWILALIIPWVIWWDNIYHYFHKVFTNC